MGSLFSSFNLQYTLDSIISYFLGYSPFERILLNASFLDLIFSSSTTFNANSYLTNPIHILNIENFLNYHFAKQPILINIYNPKKSTKEKCKYLKSFLRMRDQFDDLLDQFVTQLHKKHSAKIIVINKSIQPFLADENDKNKLFELWKYLSDNPPPPKFLTTSSNRSYKEESTWDELGFQHPLSDFRGAGQLGLANLLYFAKNHTRRAREVLSSSRCSDYWFPFAITGLNITMWLLKLMKEDKISCFFFSNDTDPINIFNSIYCYIFLEFSRYWKYSKPSDIMKFGEVSDEFRIKLDTFFSSITTSHKPGNLSSDLTGKFLYEEIYYRIDGEANPNDSNIFQTSIFA